MLRTSGVFKLPRFRSALRAAVAATLAATLAAQPAGAPSAVAQALPTDRLSPIRDAEIEQLLRDYTGPIFAAAGIKASAVRITLISDRAFNAFVANGRRIFINVGAILDSKTPNELIGVLAHETGHIAGGHLARMRERVEEAQTRAIIAMLLGGAAVAAAGASGADGNLVAGGARAALTGPQELVKRDLLAYMRTEEQAADRAAVKYLEATGQSAKGMLTTFQRFVNQSMFVSKYADPYAQSHPMPVERLAALENLAKASPYFEKKDAPTLQFRHDMARAKIYGFLEGADTVARRYPPSDTSMPARYARAISMYRFGRVDEAQKLIDGLIAAQPNNPYFWELKGQALIEGGRPAQAIPALRKAVALAPNQPLIRIMLGQALVAANQPSYLDEAIRELSRGVATETESADGFRHLAVAYGRKGDTANADLASAASALNQGDVKLARELAERAKRAFKLGSPGWLRADDIVNARAPRKS